MKRDVYGRTWIDRGPRKAWGLIWGRKILFFSTVVLTIGVVVGVIVWGIIYEMHTPTHGTVYEKTFYPGYTTTTYSTQCVSRDTKTGTCKSSISVPVTTYHSPEWYICIRRDPGDTKHNKTGCLSVDPYTFSQYTYGDHYPNKLPATPPVGAAATTP